MARWSTSNPHPTKINLFVRDGEWVAKHGLEEATAPLRFVRSKEEIGSGGTDMGKFDALEILCESNPSLWHAGYVVLDQ